MAKSSAALLLLGLILASFCVANAGRIPGEPGRKLIATGASLDGVTTLLEELVLVFDLTGLPKGVAPGTVTLKEAVIGAVVGVKSVVVQLVAGQVAELKVVQVRLRQAGIVHLVLEILGVKEVIALDLAQLKATLVNGEMRAVVVLVLDEAKKILHLRNQDGECATIDIALSISLPGFD